MRAEAECHICCIQKAEGLLEQYRVPEEKKIQAVKEIQEIVKHIGEEESAPVLMTRVMSVLEKYTGISDAYELPKKKYNELLMGMAEGICEEIRQESDPFYAALQYAVTGNYIDFGAMSDVSEERLRELLRQRRDICLDAEETAKLREELAGAKRLAYITDNAGEIVLDQVFIRILKELYPELQVTAIVRGAPVLNDATLEDARMTGLYDLTAVISNGTDIPGTPLEFIKEEAAKVIEEADLCIAKGQGNFETLRGCGRNIYYLFLCKCGLFVKKFRVERFAPVLTNEKRIVQYA